MKALKFLKTFGVALSLVAFVLATATSCDFIHKKHSNEKEISRSSNNRDNDISSSSGDSKEVTIKDTDVSRRINELEAEYRQMYKSPYPRAHYKKIKEAKEQMLYWIDVRIEEINEEIDYAEDDGEMEIKQKYEKERNRLLELKNELENNDLSDLWKKN